ncbi:MAG: hemerythrin family protein [Desulfobacterales bacterium]|nr:hemerythrin family protein [Desulfobacterales bacterium]
MEKNKTILKLKWTKELSVNNNDIDDQHKNLFNIINKLIRIRQSGSDREHILEILKELVDYSYKHFKTEDIYMMDNDFPLFLSHSQEHQKYMVKIGEFISSFEEEKTNLSTDILLFLREWWINHISETDMKYTLYIKTTNIQ